MWIGDRCIGAAALACLALTTLGCGNTTGNESHTGSDGGPGADGTAEGDVSDTTGADTSSGSGGDGTGGTTGEVTATGDTTGTTGNCVPGIPTTSQVPRLLNREYDTIVYDLLGVSSLVGADNHPPSSLLAADSTAELNGLSWEGYLEAANQIAAEVMAGDNRSRFMSCDPVEVATCYDDTIRTFGRKMFRRPLTEEEVARFMTLTTADSTWTPEQVSEAILYAFLASPSFIMVPELSAEVEGSAFKLSSHEVATRLSLMLWGSVPDAELNDAADQGLLTTSDQIRAQAERMIQLRDKAAPQVAASHEAYVRNSENDSIWWSRTPDTQQFPDYTGATRLALASEVSAFFEEVAYEGGSFQDIFLSNVAFVNQDSAAIYDLDSTQYGADITRVELDPATRPGIFTRGGFLSSFSTMLRGTFLANFVLGVDPGPPTPEAMLTPLPEGTYTTEREKIEALTSVKASCAACHSLLNPPGFVLEHFDDAGSWQDVDPLGGAIDSSADVTFADGSVRTINSPLELMQAIAQDPTARRIYAQELVAFFTERQSNDYDACLVDAIAAKLASDDSYGMLDLIVDLTQADSFRLRTVSD